MEMDFFKKAYKCWFEYQEEILKRNRFLPQGELIQSLSKIIDEIGVSFTLKENDYLYRARLMDEEFVYRKRLLEKQLSKNKIQEDSFHGYTKDQCMEPPTESAKDGRANPLMIPYLYTAKNKYTALCEVKPYLHSMVSIAKIQILRNINILDLSYIHKENDSFNEALLNVIGYNFSLPIGQDKEYQYIATQYIAEVIKNMGYEGIQYISLLADGGLNIVLFSSDKVEAIESDIYSVDLLMYNAIGFTNHDALHAPALYELSQKASLSVLEKLK